MDILIEPGACGDADGQDQLYNELTEIFSLPGRTLLRGDGFIYLLPHPALGHWISNYTITFPHKTWIPDEYTIIPHGSGTLVFSWGQGGIHSSMFGPAANPCRVGRKANECELLFIIEFRPAGLYALTGIWQKELTDRVIPFELINPVLNRLIMEALEAASCAEQLAACMDRLLLPGLSNEFPTVLDRAVNEVTRNMGSISIKELSGSVFYSERQLNRIFDQYLGMSTKTFSRLVRINKTIRLLNNPQNSITKVCNLMGFYDLPHFIRAFRSVCGLSPLEYRKNMSDFYSEIAKF